MLSMRFKENCKDRQENWMEGNEGERILRYKQINSGLVKALTDARKRLRKQNEIEKIFCKWKIERHQLQNLLIASQNHCQQSMMYINSLQDMLQSLTEKIETARDLSEQFGRDDTPNNTSALGGQRTQKVLPMVEGHPLKKARIPLLRLNPSTMNFLGISDGNDISSQSVTPNAVTSDENQPQSSSDSRGTESLHNTIKECSVPLQPIQFHNQTFLTSSSQLLCNARPIRMNIQLEVDTEEECNFLTSSDNSLETLTEEPESNNSCIAAVNESQLSDLEESTFETFSRPVYKDLHEESKCDNIAIVHEVNTSFNQLDTYVANESEHSSNLQNSDSQQNVSISHESSSTKDEYRHPDILETSRSLNIFQEYENLHNGSVAHHDESITNKVELTVIDNNTSFGSLHSLHDSYQLCGVFSKNKPEPSCSSSNQLSGLFKENKETLELCIRKRRNFSAKSQEAEKQIEAKKTETFPNPLHPNNEERNAACRKSRGSLIPKSTGKRRKMPCCQTSNRIQDNETHSFQMQYADNQQQIVSSEEEANFLPQESTSSGTEVRRRSRRPRVCSRSYREPPCNTKLRR